MKITKVSIISNKEHTIDIPMEEEEFKQAYYAWENGEYIQTAFHMLNVDQRKFIKSGITPQEWNEVFGNDDEPDPNNYPDTPEGEAEYHDDYWQGDINAMLYHDDIGDR